MNAQLSMPMRWTNANDAVRELRGRTVVRRDGEWHRGRAERDAGERESGVARGLTFVGLHRISLSNHENVCVCDNLHSDCVDATTDVFGGGRAGGGAESSQPRRCVCVCVCAVCE